MRSSGGHAPRRAASSPRSCPAICSTNPRSVCTGPPRSTGRRTRRSSAESRPSCSKTSPRSIFSGLLITIPSAPAALCSQISVTDWAKFGSAMPGHGDQELVGEVARGHVPSIRPRRAASQARLQGPQGGPAATEPPPRPSLDELPFVGKAQYRIALAHGRREGVEGRGEAHDIDRGLIELRVAARAAHDNLVAAVRRRRLRPRAPGCRTATGGVPRWEIDRADPLDAQLPAVQIARRSARPACRPAARRPAMRVAAQHQLGQRRTGVLALPAVRDCSVSGGVPARVVELLVARNRSRGARRPLPSAPTPRRVPARMASGAVADARRHRCRASRGRAKLLAARAEPVERGPRRRAGCAGQCSSRRGSPPARVPRRRAEPRAWAVHSVRRRAREAHAEDHQPVQQCGDEQGRDQPVLFRR